MKKVELKQVEFAALAELLGCAIREAMEQQRRARESCMEDMHTFVYPPGFEPRNRVDLEYWTGRLDMLRQLKAKLEQEEDDDPREEDMK